jgi:5-methylcytosine-specific restriction endonuclease McrA
VGAAVKITPKNWREFQHYKDRNPPWIRLHRGLLDNREFNALPPMACKVLVMLWLVAADTPEGTFSDDADSLAFRLRLPLKDVQSALVALKSSGFLVPAGAEQQSDDARPLAKQIAEANGFGSRHISDATKREVWQRDGGKCCACGAVEDIEYDHKHPVSKGGNSETANVHLLCRPCNRKKRTKTAEQVATPAQPLLGMRTTEAEAEALQKQPLPAKPAVEGFEAFYAAYPRKVKPKDARKAWDKLKPDAALQSRILSAIGQQRKSPQWQKDGGQFIPYPATWLNAGEWDNQAPELAAPDGSGLTALTAAFNADMDQRVAEATRPPVDLMRRLGRAA